MIAVFLLCAALPVFAQMTERDVRARLDAVYAGKADEVARALPALLQQHPQDAGVLYIQAVLTADGTLAAKRYQELSDRYPQSVWADDALYKVYQYNFSIGLYKKADEVMDQLRSRYPQSIYVTGGDAKAATPSAAAPAQATPMNSEKNNEPVQPGAAERSKPAGQTHADGRGKYYVQVGVFAAEANARTAAEKFSALAGRQAIVMPKTTLGKTQYVVLFDGFDSAALARGYSATLRSEFHIDSFVFPNLNTNGR